MEMDIHNMLTEFSYIYPEEVVVYYEYDSLLKCLYIQVKDGSWYKQTYTDTTWLGYKK